MSLDRSVNPCDDFYGFSCGKWENTHTIQMLLHTQENGGSEYDNFVKMRIKVMENLNNVLSGKINGSDPIVVQKFMSMYSNCKSNLLFNKSKMLKIIDQLTGGWPMLNGQFNEKNYNWTKAFVQIFSYLRQDFIFSLKPIVNTNSVMQLKVILILLLSLINII